MNKEYIEILKSRVEYFSDKKITDLTDDEIKEFMNLRQEVIGTMPEMKETVRRILDLFSDYLKSYIEAEERYKERVLHRD